MSDHKEPTFQEVELAAILGATLLVALELLRQRTAAQRRYQERRETSFRILEERRLLELYVAAYTLQCGPN